MQKNIIYKYTFQARFTVGATKQITGHSYFNATIGSGERVALAEIDIPVKSISPLPHETAIDTGLIGTWSINGKLTPSVLEAQRPFELQLDIDGKGNPTLLKDIDFSRPGFSSISLKSTHLNERDRSSPHRLLSIKQELLPSGETPTLPAITLATFNPKIGDWELHQITEPVTLIGLSDAVAATTQFIPAADLGHQLQRPILLNLPALTFPLIAIAPFLPLIAGFVRRRLDQKDPEKDARKKQFAELLVQLKKDTAPADLVDQGVLPFLRSHFELPTGSTTREIADRLKEQHSELAELLIQHSESSFGSNKVEINLKTLAGHLTKISLLLLIFLTPLSGATLEEANAAFTEQQYRSAAESYETLIVETPGHPNLYLNLAKARLSANQPERARAACHTALLLDPANPEGRTLMDQILLRLGQPELPGTQLLSLRPDQFLFFAVCLWVGAFIILAARRLLSSPRWPAIVCLFCAATLTVIAFWRKNHAYAPDQYMVLAKELPREPEAGTPNWDYPALHSGQIIRVSETTRTHAQVVTPDTSFWLPLDQLQQVW